MIHNCWELYKLYNSCNNITVSYSVRQLDPRNKLQRNYKQNTKHLYQLLYQCIKRIDVGNILINCFFFSNHIPLRIVRCHSLREREVLVSMGHVNFNNTTAMVPKHSIKSLQPFDTLRPRPNDRHLADDVLESVYLNGNYCIFILI